MRTLVSCLIVSLLLSASVAAKGVNTRITIRDRDSGISIDINDPTVLERFNIWAGPGTFVTVGGRRTEGQEGFIVDWPGGAVADRPAGLRRYEVRFYVLYPRSTAEQLAHVVQYEYDLSSGDGFVYLPGRSDEHWGLNVQALHRGGNYEGHWFRASRDWQTVVNRLILAR